MVLSLLWPFVITLFKRNGWCREFYTPSCPGCLGHLFKTYLLMVLPSDWPLASRNWGMKWAAVGMGYSGHLKNCKFAGPSHIWDHFKVPA